MAPVPNFANAAAAEAATASEDAVASLVAENDIYPAGLSAACPARMIGLSEAANA